MQDGLIKISGLWKSKFNGGVMLKGGVNPVLSLVIMPNDFKKTDKDPDYIAYWSRNEKQDAKEKQESLEL